MFKRSSFWLGLLLGGLAALGTRQFWLPARSSLRYPLLDLVGDAVVLCDALGAVIDTNIAAQALFGPDPFPYGVAPNQVTLDAFLGWAQAQGDTHRRLSPDDLFAPATLSRVRV